VILELGVVCSVVGICLCVVCCWYEDVHSSSRVVQGVGLVALYVQSTYSY
jgi:hypothetical protein